MNHKCSICLLALLTEKFSLHIIHYLEYPPWGNIQQKMLMHILDYAYHLFSSSCLGGLNQPIFSAKKDRCIEKGRKNNGNSWIKKFSDGSKTWRPFVDFQSIELTNMGKFSTKIISSCLRKIIPQKRFQHSQNLFSKYKRLAISLNYFTSTYLEARKLICPPYRNYSTPWISYKESDYSFGYFDDARELNNNLVTVLTCCDVDKLECSNALSLLCYICSIPLIDDWWNMIFKCIENICGWFKYHISCINSEENIRYIIDKLPL